MLDHLTVSGSHQRTYRGRQQNARSDADRSASSRLTECVQYRWRDTLTGPLQFCVDFAENKFFKIHLFFVQPLWYYVGIYKHVSQLREFLIFVLTFVGKRMNPRSTVDSGSEKRKLLLARWKEGLLGSVCRLSSLRCLPEVPGFLRPLNTQSSRHIWNLSLCGVRRHPNLSATRLEI